MPLIISRSLPTLSLSFCVLATFIHSLHLHLTAVESLDSAPHAFIDVRNI